MLSAISSATYDADCCYDCQRYYCCKLLGGGGECYLRRCGRYGAHLAFDTGQQIEVKRLHAKIELH